MPEIITAPSKPTTRRDYRLPDNTKVPGVTTVIGSQLAWNKNQLMWWAWKQGSDGKDFRDTSDAAAALGTRVHELIEATVKGQNPPIPVDCEASLLAFYEWRDMVHLTLTESEVPLVSIIHEVGGTIDYPAIVNNRRCIVDLKTSNGVYPDHRIQLAAYGMIWNEHHPNDLVTGYHLLQVGKEDGSFHHHYWPSLEHEREAFLLLLKLHRLQKQIGK